jgi:adenosylhomocysteine nucleosidase
MVGIIVAMDREIAGWLARLAVREIVDYADKTFYLGTYEGVEIVLARSGIGKTNAAMTATLLFSHFDVDYLINTGVAGGLAPAHTGDIVVATRLVYSDVDVRLIDPDLPFGQIPGDPLYAVPDPNLVARAMDILSASGARNLSGTIATADRFTTDRGELAALLSHTHDVVACDMESMAVAVAAEKFSKPFIVVRGISDVIDADDQLEVYRDVVDEVCGRTAALVAAFLRS